MGLTASQTAPGGLVSPAGYEDHQAAGLNLLPIAPSVVQPSLSFDGSAYGPAWVWSCRSQVGPAGWSTSFDQAWPCRSFLHYPLQRLSRSAWWSRKHGHRPAWSLTRRHRVVGPFVPVDAVFFHVNPHLALARFKLPVAVKVHPVKERMGKRDRHLIPILIDQHLVGTARRHEIRPALLARQLEDAEEHVVPPVVVGVHFTAVEFIGLHRQRVHRRRYTRPSRLRLLPHRTDGTKGDRHANHGA